MPVYNSVVDNCKYPLALGIFGLVLLEECVCNGRVSGRKCIVAILAFSPNNGWPWEGPSRQARGHIFLLWSNFKLIIQLFFSLTLIMPTPTCDESDYLSNCKPMIPLVNYWTPLHLFAELKKIGRLWTWVHSDIWLLICCICLCYCITDINVQHIWGAMSTAMKTAVREEVAVRLWGVCRTVQIFIFSQICWEFMICCLFCVWFSHLLSLIPTKFGCFAWFQPVLCHQKLLLTA